MFSIKHSDNFTHRVIDTKCKPNDAPAALIIDSHPPLTKVHQRKKWKSSRGLHTNTCEGSVSEDQLGKLFCNKQAHVAGGTGFSVRVK